MMKVMQMNHRPDLLVLMNGSNLSNRLLAGGDDH